MPLAVPTGALRAPGSNALLASCSSRSSTSSRMPPGKDPVQFRLDLLDRAARRSARGTADGFSPERARRRAAGGGEIRLGLDEAAGRHGMGVAFQFSHRGYFAEVAEVTVNSDGGVSVNKVWAAVDIGAQIDQPEQRGQPGAGQRHRRPQPADVVRDHHRAGTRVQSNFHEFQPVRMSQAPPEIEVHFVTTDNPPTGLGEPALPPILPAVGNAIFAATGKRIRTLPLAKSGFSWA